MTYTRTAVLDRQFNRGNGFDISKFIVQVKKYTKDIFESLRLKNDIGHKEEIKDIPSYSEQKMKYREEQNEIRFGELNSNLIELKSLLDDKNNKDKDELIGKYVFELYKTTSKWNSLAENYNNRVNYKNNKENGYQNAYKYTDHLSPIKELEKLLSNLRMQVKPKNNIKNPILKINTIQDLYTLIGKPIEYKSKKTGKISDAVIKNISYSPEFKDYVIQIERTKKGTEQHSGFDTFAVRFKPGEGFFDKVNDCIKEKKPSEEVQNITTTEKEIDRDKTISKIEGIVYQDINPTKNIIPFHPKDSNKSEKIRKAM